jgi:hypothetical protein
MPETDTALDPLAIAVRPPVRNRIGHALQHRRRDGPAIEVHDACNPAHAD